MPLFIPHDAKRIRRRGDDRRASLKAAIEYLRNEAGRLGLAPVAIALQRALVVLNNCRPSHPPAAEDDDRDG
jgi:hypothetical protein